MLKVLGWCGLLSCMFVGAARADEPTHVASASAAVVPLALTAAYDRAGTGGGLGVRGDYFYRPLRYFQIGAGVRYHFQVFREGETDHGLAAALQIAGVLPVSESVELTLSPGFGYAYVAPNNGEGGAGTWFSVDFGFSWRVMVVLAVVGQVGAFASGTRFKDPRYPEASKLVAGLPLSVGIQWRW